MLCEDDVLPRWKTKTKKGPVVRVVRDVEVIEAGGSLEVLYYTLIQQVLRSGHPNRTASLFSICWAPQIARERVSIAYFCPLLWQTQDIKSQAAGFCIMGFAGRKGHAGMMGAMGTVQ